MPLTWIAGAGLALGAGGTAYSIYENEQAQKEAKKQREEEKIAAAWQALIQAAAGTPVSIDTNLTPIPKGNVGDSVANLGQNIISTAGTLATQNRQQAEFDYQKQRDAQAMLATANPNYGVPVGQQTPKQLGMIQTIQPQTQSKYGSALDGMFPATGNPTAQIPANYQPEGGGNAPIYMMSPEETIKLASAVTPEMQNNAAYQQALGKEKQNLAIREQTQDQYVEYQISKEMKLMNLDPNNDADRQIYYGLKTKSAAKPLFEF